MKKLTSLFLAVVASVATMMASEPNSLNVTISQDCNLNGINESHATQNSLNGHSFVDLGLPSGLLWATCNVGSETPEQIGDYYAWGETQTKSNYSLSTYQYASNAISLNDISGTQYDAARVNWSGEWRMPSRNEVAELTSNCSRKDTTINGQSGLLLRGVNGNYIFIPCAGHWCNNKVEELTGIGFWTSTAIGSGCAYRAWEWTYISFSEREQGFQIRPVISGGASLSTQTHTLTLYADGCENPNVYIFDEGQQVSISAIPQENNQFVQWSDGNTDNPRILTATDNATFTAVFEKKELSSDIILQENESADYYTQFAQDYNGQRVTTATLNRQLTQSKWATLCLPFDVNKALMTALGLYNRVFEFRYAQQLDDETIQVFFVPAQSIEAGKGYIVNANSKLAQKTSFVFPNVTINTDSDNGDITSLTGYNDGTNRGNLYLVGTLRTGMLQGSTTGNTYLGLKDNKLYYPNTATGTSIRAYRGFFRSEKPMTAQKVRIIVDGADNEELVIDNGELMIDDETRNSKQTTTRKYISNGTLYIERNGTIYTAQGNSID